jgi:hypothetical protein
MPAKTNASAAKTDTATGLRFEAPPAAERSNGNAAAQYTEEAAQLKARPGEWAVLKEFTGEGSGARSGAWRLASRVKKGEIKAFAPAGSFEAVTRSNGHSKVYVRYVAGEAAEQAAEGTAEQAAKSADDK